MKGKLYVLVFLLALAAPFAASADICDDVNDMADGWNDIANGVDEMGEEGFTQAEAEEADEAIGEAFDATREFADILEDEGNNREARRGARLNRALDDLEDADTMDGIVDSMDDVVDALDAVVDYCDSI